MKIRVAKKIGKAEEVRHRQKSYQAALARLLKWHNWRGKIAGLYEATRYYPRFGGKLKSRRRSAAV